MTSGPVPQAPVPAPRVRARRCGPPRIPRTPLMSRLRFGLERRDDRLDVGERVGVADHRAAVRALDVDQGHVIGLEHAVVPDFLEHARHLQHVQIAVVDEGFPEIEKPAVDVTEVNVVNLLARAEPADNVGQFLVRVHEHLRDRYQRRSSVRGTGCP